MPSGLSARVVVVCTLIFGVTIATAARAERRPVAIIDLSGDPATAKLAAEFNPVLLGHPDLSPIPDPSIPPELYGPFRDDDQGRIEEAQSSKATAEDQLARYSFEVAQESASNGQRSLAQVMPTPGVLVLYAQLSFVRGQALLGIPKNAGAAPEAFALAHRLDPAFVPDPGRYLPDVVQAFEAAKRRWTGRGNLAVAGTGRLWVDGIEKGRAPSEIEVDAGPHVVWLTDSDRVTSARQIVVEPGRKAELEIPNAPADERSQIRRARASLRGAPDAAARAAAMRTIAALVRVRDAVLLTSPNGKIVVQTWNAGTLERPGFSALRERKAETPLELLAPLAPPAKVKAAEPDPDPKPIVDERRWYQRRTWQASIAVGVLAAIVAGYYIYQYATDDTIVFDNDISTPARIRF